MLKNPPESVVLHTERVVQHGGDVVLSGKLGQKMMSLRPRPPRGRRWNIESTIVGRGTGSSQKSSDGSDTAL